MAKKRKLINIEDNTELINKATLLTAKDSKKKITYTTIGIDVKVAKILNTYVSMQDNDGKKLLLRDFVSKTLLNHIKENTNKEELKVLEMLGADISLL